MYLAVTIGKPHSCPLPSSLQLHHDSPDANLAWLMAFLTVPPTPPRGSTGSTGGSSGKPPPPAVPSSIKAAIHQVVEASAAAEAAGQHGEAGQVEQSMLSLDRALASGLDMLEQALPGR